TATTYIYTLSLHDALPISLKAMLVDSWYDSYLGVIVLVRVIDGVLKKGQTIRMMGTGAKYPVERTGVFTPKMLQVDELGPGELRSEEHTSELQSRENLVCR